MNALVLHLRAHHGHALRYETFNFENQQEYDVCTFNICLVSFFNFPSFFRNGIEL